LYQLRTDVQFGDYFRNIHKIFATADADVPDDAVQRPPPSIPSQSFSSYMSKSPLLFVGVGLIVLLLFVVFAFTVIILFNKAKKRNGTITTHSVESNTITSAQDVESSPYMMSSSSSSSSISSTIHYKPNQQYGDALNNTNAPSIHTLHPYIDEFAVGVDDDGSDFPEHKCLSNSLYDTEGRQSIQQGIAKIINDEEVFIASGSDQIHEFLPPSNRNNIESFYDEDTFELPENQCTTDHNMVQQIAAHLDGITPKLNEEYNCGFSNNMDIQNDADNQIVEFTNSFDLNHIRDDDGASLSSYSQTTSDGSLVDQFQLKLGAIVGTSNHHLLEAASKSVGEKRRFLNQTNGLAKFLLSAQNWSVGAISSTTSSSKSSTISTKQCLSSTSSGVRTSASRNGLQTTTVLAPPGKIGIIIDTTDEGPVIYRVDEDSPLRHDVYPGDFIVAINDTDTRAMTGREITSLMVRTVGISRKLTILREEDVSLAYI
jgi:hypothetical protein